MSLLRSPRPAIPALLLALACTVAVPAAARDAAVKAARVPPVQTVDPEASAWTAGTAPAADCTRARRKLWQPGEGWIVRTITTCH